MTIHWASFLSFLSFLCRYRDRFWKKCNFDALDVITEAVRTQYGDTVTVAAAVLRWIVHHSGLDGARGGKQRFFLFCVCAS